jgi:truncated hemoglobin YjbI
MRERPLALLATGVGAGAMLALARDALGQGHRAPISLYHGVRSRWDLYLHDELTEMQTRHRQFRYVPAVSGNDGDASIRRGRITEIAFVDVDLEEHHVVLCGSPSMVAEARWRALLAGARRRHMHADPYHFQHPAPFEDAARIAQIGAEPELWAALESGPGLTRILTRFYARVFVDPQLAPFFQQITQDRAIQKQYEFLADLMSGERNYFGLNPFNAHHWMVISDALFDYREELFEQVLREHGLPPELIRRWMALHERFRSDIVKAAPRGLVSQGIEQPLHTHVIEHLSIDTVCDGCGDEIPALRPSRYQYRSGTLHCASCAGIRE